MDELKKSIDLIGKELVEELARQIIQKDKIATGKLLKSLDYEVIETIKGFTIQILAEPYLMNVNDGRKPGKMPPIGKIESWVKAKPIKFPGRSVRETSFVIAKSIARLGVVPTRIVDESIKTVLQNVDSIIQAGLSKDIQNLLKKI